MRKVFVGIPCKSFGKGLSRKQENIHPALDNELIKAHIE